MNELTCPGCGHEFTAEDYDCGNCPKCGEYHYYWDDDWDDANDCDGGSRGFYWENN